MTAPAAGPNPHWTPVPQPAQPVQHPAWNQAPPPSPEHSSVAWLLHGIGQTPGYLVLRQGWLCFASHEGVHFTEPLGPQAAVTFPWWYFGGGFKITSGGRRYRVSLARPNNALAPGRAAAELVGLETVSAAMSIADAAEGRRSGKVWRSLLVG